jgi:dodecin
MSVTKTIEISSCSDQSFEDAINKAIQRTTKTIHNVSCATIEKKSFTIENAKIKNYYVTMKMSFEVEG